MKRLLLILLTTLFAVQTAFADTHTHLKFEIRGINNLMGQNVISRLKIERKDVKRIMTPAEVENFSRQSLTAVSAAVMPYGYYHASATSSIRQESDGWKITYFVSKGQPVLVKKVDIEISGAGEGNTKIQKFVKQFPLRSGDIFNSIIYSDAKDKLFDVINNQGFIKAAARESKVLVNTDNNTAVIILHLQTNERYYFGKMHFNKNDYSAEFMQRFNRFHSDEPFSSSKILEYQQDMNNSRYFKQVLVMPDFEGAENYQIPLQTSIVPVNARRYAFGIGYGTFTKFRFTAGVNFRRLTDTGHSLDAQLKLSSVLSGVAMKYFIPGRNPLTEQWVIGANYQKFVPKNGASNSWSTAFGYTKKFHHWNVAGNINYLRERYFAFNEPKRDSQLLYPNLDFSYLKTDSIVQPTYGRALNIGIQGASNNMMSSTSFLQGEVKGKILVSPFSFAHLILRGDVGYTVVHDLNDLPLSMRYFAGGMTTVRGYEDSSIGPGRFLTVASIEYRNHIAYDISGAVFYDIGTASNHFGTPLKRGAGVGLVYESIIGPIKIYAEHGINNPKHPWQYELSLGPEF